MKLLCECCKKEFEAINTPEEMEKELKDHFGQPFKAEDCVVLCQMCWLDFMKDHQRMIANN